MLEAGLVESYLKDYMATYEGQSPEKAKRLLDSVNYSLFTGGKRFRPVLSLLTAKALQFDEKKVLPFACALEMIHTYSLIHDDLPSMDNDDERRGRPTNHKVYGEALALLAGDALITEAPLMVVRGYSDKPEVATKLVELLCDSAGMVGMIGGQVVDLVAQGQIETKGTKELTQTELEDLHNRKTGALIRAATLGAGIVAGADDKTLDKLEKFGVLLGMAFQLADDIHDHDPSNPEATGYPKYIGVDGTGELLDKTTQQALSLIESFGSNAQPLKDIAIYNRNRKT